MPTSARASITAAVLTAAIFLLYLATLSPSVAMWDAGEYIAAASDMGIPHQPGNPLFLLIAHVAGLIPLSDTYAVRINVLAAASGAVAAGLWFLCAERLLRSILPHTVHRFTAAASAALLGAAAFTVWNQSVVMEKVYPLALIGLSLTSLLLLKWIDTARGEEQRGDRILVLIAYLTGLTYAIHPAGLLTGPAALVAVLRHRPATLRRWRLIAVTAVAFFAGTSPFAILPIRAAHQPYVNESAVSACEDGTIAVSCTFSAETMRRLQGTIAREQYGGNPVLQRRGPLSAQLGMYWLYFKWQWIRDLRGTLAPLQNGAAAAMLLLGIAGLFSLRRAASAPLAPSARADRVGHPDHRDAHLWYLGTLTVTFTLALIFYLNFRYGWSQSPHLGDSVPREPRDRDYFFMWTFSLWGLLAGLGLAQLTRAWRPRIAVFAIAVVTLVPLTANWTAASRTGQAFTAEWARDLLMSLEENAVIITHGDNDSFPLWYAQAVERLRPDVTVALTPYLGMEWYARQLNRRAGLWQLTDAELDSILPYTRNDAVRRFDLGAVTATLEPGFITRDQILVMRAIRDSFPARPVYFSAGGYSTELGLDPYVKRVGLVNKLMPEPVREDPDTVRIEGTWVDVTGSLELWGKYGGARQLVREGRWVDSGSSSIPLFYAGVGQALAFALQTQGRMDEAREVIELARQVALVLQ